MSLLFLIHYAFLIQYALLISCKTFVSLWWVYHAVSLFALSEIYFFNFFAGCLQVRLPSQPRVWMIFN